MVSHPCSKVLTEYMYPHWAHFGSEQYFNTLEANNSITPTVPLLISYNLKNEPPDLNYLCRQRQSSSHQTMPRDNPLRWSSTATGFTRRESQNLLDSPLETPLISPRSEGTENTTQTGEERAGDSSPGPFTDDYRDPSMGENDVELQQCKRVFDHLDALEAAGGFMTARIDELEMAQADLEDTTDTFQSVILSHQRATFLMSIVCFIVIISLFALWAMFPEGDHFEVHND